MKSIWKTRKKFDIKIARKILFLIDFNVEINLASILEGHPWLFRKQMVIFYRLTATMDRSLIKLVEPPLWLKVGYCPLDCDKKDLAHAISSTFGGLL